MPNELQRQIFQDSLVYAAQSGEEASLGHQKMVGDCYSIGFGIEQNIHQALSWYEKAAHAGSVEATESFLRVAGPEFASESLGTPVYCQWLCRVLLSAFNQHRDGSTERADCSTAICRLQGLLCTNPEVARIPLEKALEKFISTKDFVVPEVIDDTTTQTEARLEWVAAVNAIRRDDQEALRNAISRSPAILQGRPDGSRSLAYVAAESDRAGLLRMLIEDYGVDCRLKNVDGLSPLARAVRLGNTAAVRVLLFSDRNVKLEGDIAAMDTGAEGGSGKTYY
jgi:TPR repeat protein